MLSFVLAVLTLLLFCIGFAPIPLTALVCYPAAFAGGIASIGTGARALREIRENGEGGRPFALIALWVGVLTILAVAVSVTLTALLLPHVVNFIRQLWIATPAPMPWSTGL